MLSIDYSPIIESLWVGSYPQSPEDVLHLKAEGVDAILNLQSDADFAHRAIQWDLFWKFYVSKGFKVVRVSIIDFDPADLDKKLGQAVDALDQLFREGRRVYLHCTAGVNRSPTTAIAWMMQHQGMTKDDAVELFQSRRSCDPYPEVLEAWARRIA